VRTQRCLISADGMVEERSGGSTTGMLRNSWGSGFQESMRPLD
jgi:hypothetical protein